MNYVRGTLSAGTAIFLTLFGLEFWFVAKPMRNAKAIGLSALAGIALEVLYSPLAWLLALSLFALFFVAGGLRSKTLRILFFWAPVAGSCILAFGMVALFVFLWLHFRQG